MIKAYLVAVAFEIVVMNVSVVNLANEDMAAEGFVHRTTCTVPSQSQPHEKYRKVHYKGANVNV